MTSSLQQASCLGKISVSSTKEGFDQTSVPSNHMKTDCEPPKLWNGLLINLWMVSGCWWHMNYRHWMASKFIGAGPRLSLDYNYLTLETSAPRVLLVRPTLGVRSRCSSRCPRCCRSCHLVSLQPGVWMHESSWDRWGFLNWSSLFSIGLWNIHFFLLFYKTFFF